MASYPRIQSPCPYIDRLAGVMDGDMCRVCQRQVFDLTALSDEARAAFLGDCSGEVCVSYKLPARSALAAALVAAAMAAPIAAAAETITELVVVAGGMRAPAHAEYVRDTDGALPPLLPVAFEPRPTPAAIPTSDAKSHQPPPARRTTRR